MANEIIQHLVSKDVLAAIMEEASKVPPRTHPHDPHHNCPECRPMPSAFRLRMSAKKEPAE